MSVVVCNINLLVSPLERCKSFILTRKINSCSGGRYTPVVTYIHGWNFIHWTINDKHLTTAYWWNAFSEHLNKWKLDGYSTGFDISLQEQVQYFISKKPARHLNILIHALKSSAGSHSRSDSGSVCIMSSWSLLAFPLSVSLMSLRLCYICFSVSRTCKCARLLIVATPVLKAAVPNRLK